MANRDGPFWGKLNFKKNNFHPRKAVPNERKEKGINLE